MRYYDRLETPKSGKTFLEGGLNRLPKTDEKVAVYFQSIDKVKFDRGFDGDGYPILLEYALQEDGTRFSKYNAVADEDGIYQPDLEGIQDDLDNQAKQEADATKQETLDKLTVEVNGKVFYADTEARVDIRDAIGTAEDTGQNTTPWKLAEEYNGERIVQVTLEELKQASAKALQTKGSLVGAIEG